MGLRDSFIKLMSEYQDVYDEVVRTNKFSHPFSHVITKDIPNDIRNLVDLPQEIYKVVGSNGKGRWTLVPWISILDKRITNSAQKGVYIVYLLNKDTKKLYLTLQQGATSVSQGTNGTSDKVTFTGIAGSNSKKALDQLNKNTEMIRQMINNPKAPIGVTMTGSKSYDSSSIYSIEYSLENFPDEQKLKSDLELIIDLYSDYYNKVFLNKNSSTWWPTLEEYNPGITKDMWLECLNDGTIKEDYFRTLACYYANGGVASCVELVEKYGKDIATYRSHGIEISSAVLKKYNLEKCIDKETGKSYVYPVAFLSKRANKDESGSVVWKLRSELYEALREFDILRYLNTHPTGVFDSWEIINEQLAIKTCDKTVFERGESGVPRSICWFFGADVTPAGESKEIIIRYDGKDFGAKIYCQPDLRRRIVWRAEFQQIIDTYKDNKNVRIKFFNKGNDVFEIEIVTGDEMVSVKDKINRINEYILNAGFNYPGNMVENYYLSLKSKPFVILAGTSGTGKTRLVKLFADAIGAEYKLVPVRPDWSDSSDLFGHVSLNGKFVPGAIIDFVKEAQDHPDKPYFLCLDEMNLARVEYYLSDFLSVIETRNLENGTITSEPLIGLDKYGEDKDAAEKYGEISYPENLYVVGTVNMDETTFPFSKKVLDRANTIEFSYVDLVPDFNEFGGDVEAFELGNDFLKTEYMLLKDCVKDQNYIVTLCTKLQDINEILKKANAHVGYRVRDEIVFYMLNNKCEGGSILPENEALDNAIMQKILPRIQGSSTAVKNMLGKLFVVCAGSYTDKNGNSDADKMAKVLEEKNCTYPKSAEKIQMMVQRFEEDGFTSYWL